MLLTSKPLNYDLCHRFYSYLINLHGIKQIAITINSPYHLSMMTSITILITLRLELICLITVRAPLAEGALTMTCGIIIKDHSSIAGIIIWRSLTLSMITTDHPHPSTNCAPIHHRRIPAHTPSHHLNPHAYTSNCYEHWLLGAEERAVSSLNPNANMSISLNPTRI